MIGYKTGYRIGYWIGWRLPTRVQLWIARCSGRKP